MSPIKVVASMTYVSGWGFRRDCPTIWPQPFSVLTNHSGAVIAVNGKGRTAARSRRVPAENTLPGVSNAAAKRHDQHSTRNDGPLTKWIRTEGRSWRSRASHHAVDRRGPGSYAGRPRRETTFRTTQRQTVALVWGAKARIVVHGKYELPVTHHVSIWCFAAEHDSPAQMCWLGITPVGGWHAPWSRSGSKPTRSYRSPSIIAPRVGRGAAETAISSEWWRP